MPGPLPNPQRRRRNQPTIPTTVLPVEGRKGAAPKCPYRLGVKGRAWWKWAWGLPQATAWDAGALYAVARRARLEDDLHSLGNVAGLDELLGVDYLEVKALIRSLKSVAGGTVGVMKEMRELDNRLGLNPKGMADLRWSIGEPDEPVEPAAPMAGVRRLRAVDAASA